MNITTLFVTAAVELVIYVIWCVRKEIKLNKRAHYNDVITCPTCGANYRRQYVLLKIKAGEGCVHCDDSLKGAFVVR